VEPIAVVGLGNPGTEYDETRHNVGFKVLDALSWRWKKKFKAGKGEYLVARAELSGQEVFLIKPLTFMNNSGIAVADAIGRLSIPLSSMLVVVDDFALPLGTLRMRPAGSDGGHHGLYSVIYQLQSEEFPRLRCGIGRAEAPPGEAMAEFVLSRFDPNEVETVREMVERAGDAVSEFVRAGVSEAMSKYNS
jgi:PTH1 family peptidyl-tRNA hydrolase